PVRSAGRGGRGADGGCARGVGGLPRAPLRRSWLHPIADEHGLALVLLGRQGAVDPRLGSALRERRDKVSGRTAAGSDGQVAGGGRAAGGGGGRVAGGGGAAGG